MQSYKMMQTFIIPPRVFIPALVLGLVLYLTPSVFNNQNRPDKMENGTVRLQPPELKGNVTIEETLLNRRSIRTYKDDPVRVAQIGQLLWAAQGITLESNGFRTAPSAGATYPLEVYLLAGDVDGLDPGLYRYVPDRHLLEKVADGDLRNSLADASLGQDPVRYAPASVIISADYERTAGRYGERAIRFVHMETGHAAQNVCLQAVSLGLGTVIVGAFNDQQVAEVLGLPANEEPLYIIPVGWPE
jgi:SagB-type dehydrogenase family enzyme